MYNVALVHVRTGCSQREIKNIVRLKNSSLPIVRWVSYVEPGHMDKVEPFSPENAERHPFDPTHPQQRYGLVPAILGDRFILGGSIYWLRYVFEQTFRVNINRFVPLQFHSPLDIVGGNSAALRTEEEKQEYLESSSKYFCKFLEAFQLERHFSLSVRFDDSTLLWMAGWEKQPSISLNWHSTLDNMLTFIQKTDAKKEG